LKNCLKQKLLGSFLLDGQMKEYKIKVLQGTTLNKVENQQEH